MRMRKRFKRQEKPGKLLMRAERTTSLFTSLELGEYWDMELDQELALAPKDLPRGPGKDKVNRLTYDHQNALFARSRRVGVESELLTTPKGRILWVGRGLGRGEPAIMAAVKWGYDVTIVDVSGKACKNARAFVKANGLAKHVTVIKADVREALRSGEIRIKDYVLVVLELVIQTYKYEEAWDFLIQLGSLLDHVDILLLHPLPEDNEEVTWGKSTPYALEDLQVPLEVGHEGPVKITVAEDKHRYYHQTYSLLRIKRE